MDTGAIVKLDGFDAPVRKAKKGEYKMKPGQTVYVCFSTDFLIEEADEWRKECWEMMRERPDLHFLFLTKRIERFWNCIPDDWGDGYENVTIGCTVENQARADKRLSLFKTLPIRHKNIHSMSGNWAVRRGRPVSTAEAACLYNNDAGGVLGMKHNLIYPAVMWAVGAMLVGLGIYARRRKKPMWFWTGEHISPDEVSDVAAFNRANGRMWQLSSVPFWIAGPIEFWYPQAALIFFALACTVGIAWVMWYHNKIDERYKKL